MSTIRPVVNWQSPEKTPEVKKGEIQIFWLAVKSKARNGNEWRKYTFPAYYINKPLEYADDDIDKMEPLDDDHHVDTDGYPISSIGWHNELEHADFSGYYEPISFREDYVLLGWGEYLTPEPPK